MPAVCAKTGAPTTDSVRLSGSAAPGWSGWMILFGLFAWAFAATMSSRRYELVLPFKREVLQRYRSWRRAGAFMIALGLILTVVAAALGGQNAAVLLGVSFVGLVFIIGNEWKNAVGVRLSDDGDLTVTRVHPDFERAWRVLNGR